MRLALFALLAVSCAPSNAMPAPAPTSSSPSGASPSAAASIAVAPPPAAPIDAGPDGSAGANAKKTGASGWFPGAGPPKSKESAWGHTVNDAFGDAGVPSEGGGGRGEGMCLCGGEEDAPKPAAEKLHGAVRRSSIEVDGRLPAEVVARILWQNFTAVLACYEPGWSRSHSLTGSVTMKLLIDRSGAVSSAAASTATLSDRGVVRCIEGALGKMSFPQPEGGAVTVVTGLDFRPR